MAEMMLARREFVRSIATLGALGAMPPALLAKAKEGDWRVVRQLFEATLSKGKIPGMAAALGHGTAPAAFLNAGTIASGSRAAVTPDTLWRVYSMTKPVTGMAAMMLIEDGDLRLDQPVADFIPGFAKARVLTDPDNSLDSRPANGMMTIRHLLTHTAGLGYSIITKGPLLQAYNEQGILPAQVSRTKMPGVPDYPTAPSLAEFADRLATLPLIADPGARWSYSVSLDLLGRIIEIAAGRPFDAFLQQRLFDPAGMKNTVFQVADKDVSRLTTNYFALPTGSFPVDPGATSIYLDKPAFPFGGAGLVSSARDYDRFLAMLMGMGKIGGKRIMKPETAKLGMSNLLPDGADTTGTFADGQGFGAGGRVVMKETPGGAGIGTFGWGGAAATIAFVDPKRGIRASGFAQYMPDAAFGFPTDFSKSVYASLV
ncbi:serine hydrolase domain-containing protein [Sphingobium boeckii]|uniref:CubicO group peptidase (Beta-lactamase class C family) n=1 Tax=Sphingobium boeckii TaxID=1082345 RepID=A0A7W9AIG2_9SPHN|nr:serine hydrolase domain-containing protein [Sphingobium boeckii]MBB5686096.1 CubicO group peptidase (beta-lactamase class C family) [Sphingobium boeckii]